MTKTEEVFKRLQLGENTEEIKKNTGASEPLISRCRKKYEAMKEEANKVLEENPTDEEFEEVVKKIKITPDKKYLTNEKQEAEAEEYHCMGCDHRWKSKKIPGSCPGCGAEF